MCAEETLETVADALDGDVVVGGPRPVLETVGERAVGDDGPRVVATGVGSEFSEAVRDAGVVVVAMDGSSTAADTILRAAGDAEGFLVAVFGGHDDERVDLSVLDAVRGTVDATLLACPKRPPVDPGSREAATDSRTRRSRPGLVARGALDFVRMIREPGHVNLDLADARTVLTEGSIAVLCGGTASLEQDGSTRAVRRAFEAVPSSVDARRGGGALVSVSGGPEMSIDDAIAAVRAVREYLGDSELIWGVATDGALSDRVTVDVVVDDVTYRPPLSAGDPCRRCGAALSVYAFGEQTTLACEACGFADLSASLGEPSGQEPDR